MSLPPTSTKGSGDANPVTTFRIDTPNIPITHTGTIATLGTVAVAGGGTGQTSYTDGQLLIGNTTGNTLTKSTLTAGTGITITNGNGTISIAASSSGFTPVYLYVSNSGSTTAGNVTNFTTTNNNDGGGTYSSGRFTTPGSGTQYYVVSCYTTGSANNVKNTVHVNASARMILSNSETNGPGSQDGTATVRVTGGDIIDVRPIGGTGGSSSDNYMTIVRVS